MTRRVSYSIREAVVADRSRIVELYNTLGRPSRPRLEISELLVAQSEDKVVGCAGVQRFAAGSYLFGLAVERRYRRQGIGSALTCARVERARASGSPFAVVLAMFWNVRFFRRLGFALVRRSELPEAALALDDLRNPLYRRSAVLTMPFYN